MPLPSYVVHSMEGRARLRHSVLGTAAGMEKALEALSVQKKILEIRPGRSSVLLLLESRASLSGICKALEETLPELRRPAVATGISCAEGALRLWDMSPRKLENRALVAVLGFSAVLGLAGSGKAHALTSAAFALLAARHIWTRRQAL